MTFMILNKKDLLFYLKEDRRALGINKKRPKFFGDEIWKFQIVLRKLEYYSNKNQTIFTKIAKNYYKFLHHKKGMQLGFSIPVNVFGSGLRINHYGYIVVNKDARVGKNCDIHQGVNIGQGNKKGDTPTIGDNVWIGPGAKLFGKIEIADGIKIGANSVVNKTFLDKNVTIVGAPAYSVSKGKSLAK